MTHKQIASQALQMDAQRRDAWARGDYTQSRELLSERNRLILELPDGWNDRRLTRLFIGKGN